MVDDHLGFIKHMSIVPPEHPQRLGTVKQGSIGFTVAAA